MVVAARISLHFGCKIAYANTFVYNRLRTNETSNEHDFRTKNSFDGFAVLQQAMGHASLAVAQSLIPHAQHIWGAKGLWYTFET